MLVDMGIIDFKITKCREEGLYRIVRGEDGNSVFRTLSEGKELLSVFCILWKHVREYWIGVRRRRSVLLLLMILFQACPLCMCSTSVDC